MYALRMGVCLALAGWMAADAHAQLGTYGAPDPIAWNQRNAPPAGPVLVATPAAYASPADGRIPTPALTPMPAPASGPASGLSGMLSQPGPSVGPAGDVNTTVMPQGGYMQEAGNCDNPGGCGCAGGCGGCGSDCGCCCSPWYASVSTLYMTRNAPNTLYTSAQSAALVNQGHFDDFNGAWGGQATIGYRFGCCCDWAVEATYWGLQASDTDGAPNITGPYNTPFRMGSVDILGTVGGSPNGNQSATDYYDNSPEHHIWREWQAQNFEVNLVKNLCGGQCSRVSVDFLSGVRWFRFQDSFVFGAQHSFDNSIYAGDWIYTNDFITNDLVGLQTGFIANYRFLECWTAFVRPEFGVYDNHSSLDYNMYATHSATGQQFQASSSTYPNQNYPVHTTNDGFAFLTQVDVGLDWQITRHISAQGGYRVVAATGIGLADNQVPFYGNDTQAINNIQRNGSLLLSGGFAGLTFTW